MAVRSNMDNLVQRSQSSDLFFRLSDEAKEYVNTASPIEGPKEASIEIWEAIREGYRSFTHEISNDEKNNYIQSVVNEVFDDVNIEEIMPKNYKKKSSHIMYIHGGAWTLGNSAHLYQNFSKIAYETSMKVYAVNYRLAPEHPFPNGLNDCVSVYKHLIRQHDTEKLFLLGDSAGGNLAIATALKARELDLPRASGIALSSPVTDLEKNGESHETLVSIDPKLTYDGSLLPSIKAYVGDCDIKDPLISVINADYSKDFPPVSIHVGSREVLLSDSIRLNELLQHNGRGSNLHVYDGLWHNVQEHGFIDADRINKPIISFFNSICEKHQNQ